MSTPQIERSTDSGRFTLEEMRRLCRESKAFWNSPEGKAEKRRLEQKAEKRRANPIPTRFPELAGKGTKPAVRFLASAADVSASFGI